MSVVNNTIGTLSSGEIGQYSAEVVSQNTVNHPVVNSDNYDSRGFQTSGAANVPLPVTGVTEELEMPEMLDLPEMLILDDLSEGEKEILQAIDLPELPDFEEIECGLRRLICIAILGIVTGFILPLRWQRELMIQGLEYGH